MSKRIISILLSVLMLVSAFASVLTVSAAAEPGVVYVNEDGRIPGFEGKVYTNLTAAAQALGKNGGTIYLYGTVSSLEKPVDVRSDPDDISKKRETIYIKAYNDDPELGAYMGPLHLYDGDIVFDNVSIIGPTGSTEWWWHANGFTITLESGCVSSGGELQLGGITTQTTVNGGGRYVINSDNIGVTYATSNGAYWEWLGTSKSGEIVFDFNGGRYGGWIYGGSRNTRTTDTPDSTQKANLIHNGNVTYNFNGGKITGVKSGNQYGGTVNGNVVVNLNGGTYNGSEFYFGSSNNMPTLSATGNNVYVFNKKDIYNNGAIIAPIKVADLYLANEDKRADRFVIINNAEVGSAGDIVDNSTAEYKINVTNGRLEPVFAANAYDGKYDAKNALLGFKAFGGIPHVNGVALPLNSNGYYTIAKGTTNVTIVSAPVYVSENGDDANAGTSAATAVKTMAAAYEILGAAGGKVVVDGDVEMASYNGTGELIITNTDGVDTFTANLIYAEDVTVSALTIENVGLIPENEENTLILTDSSNLAIAGSYPANVAVDATKAIATVNRKINITSGKIGTLTLGYGEGAINENLVVESGADAIIGSVVLGGENAVEFKKNVTLELAGTISSFRFNNVSKIAGALKINVNTKSNNFVIIGELPKVVGSTYAVFSNAYGASNTTVAGSTATLTIPSDAVAVVTDANGTKEIKESSDIILSSGVTRIVYKVPTPIESAPVVLNATGGSVLVRTQETEQYTVTYKYTAGGSAIGDDVVYTPYGNVAVTATIAAKPGYILSTTYQNNYTLQANGGTASKFNIANADGTFSRTAILRNGTAPTVSVTLDVTGIDGVTGEAPAITAADWKHLATVTIPDGGTLAKDGYVFAGWMYGDTLYRPGDSFYIEKNEAITFKAFFRLIVYYDIIFDINGATGTAPTIDRQIEDAIIGLPSADGLTRENCEFAGWTDGNEIYQPGDEYRVGNADITFRALWDKFYTVTFDANGATAGTAPTQDAVKAGTVITLPDAADLEKDGNVFAGWTDGIKTYKTGDLYTVYAANVTLEAVWEPEFSMTLIYVSEKKGDDTNTGATSTSPVKTINRAITLAGKNDATVVIMDKVTWPVDNLEHEGHITFSGKDPITGTEYPEAGLDRSALWDAPVYGPATLEYLTDYPQSQYGAWVPGHYKFIIGTGYKNNPSVGTSVIGLKSSNRACTDDLYIEFNAGSYMFIQIASYLGTTVEKNVEFVVNPGFGGGTVMLGSDNNPIKINGTTYVTFNGKNTPGGVKVGSNGTQVDTLTKGFQVIINDGNKTAVSVTNAKVPQGAPQLVVYSGEGGKVTHAYNEPGYVNVNFPAGSVAKIFNRETAESKYLYAPGKVFLENGTTDITYLSNEIISAVDVAIPAPVAGEYPVTKFENEKFSAEIEWLNLDTDRFIYNTEYQAKVTVTSLAQYIFDDVPMFKVGGVGGLAEFDGDKVVCTVTFPSTGIAPIHTLTFDANGGGADPADIEAEHLEVVTLPTKGELNIDGQDLAGWLYNEKIYAPGASFEVPNTDVAFTAVWGNVHTVKFLGGDNTSIGVGGAIADKQWAHQKTYVLPANNNNYTYNRLGVTFIGWSDGTNTYSAGSEYVMVDTDVTFTAQWKSSATSSGTPIIWIINPEDIISPTTPVDPADPAEPTDDDEIKVVVNKDARFFEGYTTGEFKPEENMTRAEAITVILRLIADEDEVKGLYKPTFSDAKTHWAASNIGYLQEAGLLKMFKGSKLSPDKAITREEFVQLIYALGTLKDGADVSFSDVKKSASSYEAICAAAAAGIVEGYPDGTFGMGKTITRAEIVTMLIRFLERTPNISGANNPYTDIDESHWAYKYVIEASK